MDKNLLDILVLRDLPVSNEWKIVRIEDIAEVVGGSTPSTQYPENFDGDIPWLTPKDLAGPHPRYMSRGNRNLSRKGLESCSAQLLPPKSILLSSRAPIGYLAIAANHITTNQGFRTLIVKSEYEHEYIYYWLLANTDELERHATGSTFKELSGSALKKIQICLPSNRAEQRAIAHILGTLDDKIELNRRMNETLEAMAQALFKSWFMDFDPVRAKMEGRPTGLPKEIEDLFPDSFEDSELWEIPRGWKVSTIGECFRLTMGQSPPGETYNDNEEGLPFFQGSTDFDFRYPVNRKFCSAPTRVAISEDTLVSVRAPVGDINMAWEKCCIGRGVASIRHKSGKTSYTYYAAWNLQAKLQKYEHTGTVFGAINKKQLEIMKIIEPSEILIGRFESIVRPLDCRIRFNTYEIRTLAALRDTLLPNLLSGDIRVKEVERFLKREL